jgi:hypothetical protein
MPDDAVVCAIGDVHGQLAHLRAPKDWLTGNVFPNSDGRCRLITLGDDVDRGPCGVGVLGFLARFDPPGVRVMRLIGNHDMFLNAFLHDETIDFGFIESWFGIGADRRRFVIATEAAVPAALDRIPARKNAAAISWTERPIP